MIRYRDLQYQAEADYYQKLRRLLVRLRDRHAEFAEQERAKEAEFYQLLAHSLKISEAPKIQELVDQVKRALGADSRIHVFVTSFPSAQAMCTPRSTYAEGNAGEPVVIVSQHFLNGLEPLEQRCIIGHELGHVLLEHAFIPAKAILAFPFRVGDVGALKADVLKWMICSEISCDLLGLIAGNRQPKAFVSGILKFTTGLDQTGLLSLGDENISTLVHNQFQELTISERRGGLDTHPLTLLRARIVETAVGTRLVQHFGEDVPQSTLVEYKKEFNQAIDMLVRGVYPEIPTSESMNTEGILFEMSLAVVLADEKLDPGELAALTQLSSDRRDLRRILTRIRSELSREGHTAVVQKLVKKSLAAARHAGMNPAQAKSLVRQLFLIAGSDGHIEPREFAVILQFGKEFGLNVQHLLRMKGTLGLR